MVIRMKTGTQIIQNMRPATAIHAILQTKNQLDATRQLFPVTQAKQIGRFAINGTSSEAMEISTRIVMSAGKKPAMRKP